MEECDDNAPALASCQWLDGLMAKTMPMMEMAMPMMIPMMPMMPMMMPMMHLRYLFALTLVYSPSH